LLLPFVVDKAYQSWDRCRSRRRSWRRDCV